MVFIDYFNFDGVNAKLMQLKSKEKLNKFHGHAGMRDNEIVWPVWINRKLCLIFMIRKVIRIHSPMRAQRKEDWSNIPSRESIKRAHAAAVRLKQGESGRGGDVGQFRNCKFWGEKGADYNGPISGSLDMGETRKNSNYSKWELMPFERLRKEAQEYYKQMEGVSLYKMDGNKLDDLVCIRHA
ncbi:hypothetical protein Cgig2_000983 [Carnegiea gigantea]|uniref:Uncharacterized protein n=1 Tax=Carnegiea gigantea TaxID=171969 RepID=A0A9Q1QC83_9CARY|nr:hypothetical protein Cgig2_000983 [Carnegiea gigantea]